MDAKTRRDARVRRHRRVRTKIVGTAERPRLAVFRSNRHIYAQLIDDDAARTIASASDREVRVGGAEKSGGKGKTDPAKEVGGLLAERAKAAGV
jgi:large subunit ribosomal protein L18